MRGTAALLVIVLFAPVLSGCLNWNEHNNEFYDCDSEEYWVDVSENSPYPGLECESGPGRQLFITIFVYRDNDGVEWLINETSIATGVELINSVYNPYGIYFALDEIVWIDEAYPELEDGFGDQISLSQLGDGFIEGYNPANVNIVMQSTGWGAYSMFPWYTREYYFSTVRASSFATSYEPRTGALPRTLPHPPVPRRPELGFRPRAGLHLDTGLDYTDRAVLPNWRLRLLDALRLLHLVRGGHQLHRQRLRERQARSGAE